MRKHIIQPIFVALMISSVLLVGCQNMGTNETSNNNQTPNLSTDSTGVVTVNDTPVANGLTTELNGIRDNTTVVLVPEASGVTVYSNSRAIIDASNADQGYVIVEYIGLKEKVKLQIKGSDDVTYTYNLQGGQEIFPLSAGSGDYQIAVLENVKDKNYATALSQIITVSLTNEFGAFLYPNQYVMFNSESKTVIKAKELALSADTDLDVVSNVYNYIIKAISYDFDKAETLPSGYVPDVDETLSTNKGICLDYASIMTAMLRSQRIPTRLEVGYAGEAYHAWISTYIQDIGWINGIIQFDGTNWELMDPTFAANTSEKTLKKFIGDGSNYTTVYVY